jgi:hypothetical protein
MLPRARFLLLHKGGEERAHAKKMDLTEEDVPRGLAQVLRRNAKKRHRSAAFPSPRTTRGWRRGGRSAVRMRTGRTRTWPSPFTDLAKFRALGVRQRVGGGGGGRGAVVAAVAARLPNDKRLSRPPGRVRTEVAMFRKISSLVVPRRSRALSDFGLEGDNHLSAFDDSSSDDDESDLENEGPEGPTLITVDDGHGGIRHVRVERPPDAQSDKSVVVLDDDELTQPVSSGSRIPPILQSTSDPGGGGNGGDTTADSQGGTRSEGAGSPNHVGGAMGNQTQQNVSMVDLLKKEVSCTWKAAFAALLFLMYVCSLSTVRRQTFSPLGLGCREAQAPDGVQTRRGECRTSPLRAPRTPANADRLFQHHVGQPMALRSLGLHPQLLSQLAGLWLRLVAHLTCPRRFRGRTLAKPAGRNWLDALRSGHSQLCLM